MNFCHNTEQNLDILTLAKKIKKILPNTRIKNMSSSNVQRSYNVSFDKITSELEFKPTKNIEDGIHEVIDLIKFGENNR